MAAEEERTVEESEVREAAKEEMMSMKYMWSGCHREMKDDEERRILVLGAGVYTIWSVLLWLSFYRWPLRPAPPPSDLQTSECARAEM